MPRCRRLAAGGGPLLVVATEEPTSLTDAYAVLKLHAATARAARRGSWSTRPADRAVGERTYATLAPGLRPFLGRRCRSPGSSGGMTG